MELQEPTHTSAPTPAWAEAFDRAWPIPGAPGVRAITDKDDAARAQALLDLHPDRAEKIGAGVLTFALAHVDTGTHLHLLVVHPDGTLSRLRQGNPETMKTTHERLMRALRGIVGSQVRGARARHIAAGETTCAHCGTDENLTADHLLPFAVIAGDWLRAHPEAELARTPLTLRNVRFSRSRSRLTIPALETDWIRYHHARARYQILCGDCNRAAAGEPRGSHKEKASTHVPRP